MSRRADIAERVLLAMIARHPSFVETIDPRRAVAAADTFLAALGPAEPAQPDDGEDDASANAELVGMVRLAANRVFGGNATFADDDIARLEWAAKAGVEAAKAPAPPAPDADGWIPWHGGECPVPGGTLVEVQYRDGDKHAPVEAGMFSWELGKPHIPERDITAYRVVTPAAPSLPVGVWVRHDGGGCPAFPEGRVVAYMRGGTMYAGRTPIFNNGWVVKVPDPTAVSEWFIIPEPPK